MFDVLIRGAQVVDGSGQDPIRADVAIHGQRIAALAPVVQGEAACVIDATGLHLAPGFIDAHTHSDLSLLVDGRAQSKIRQGVTTEVIGNCGSSVAPLAGQALEETRAELELLELELDWRSFGEYLERLRSPGTAVNVVPQVGHNTVRGAVLGYGETQPDSAQLAAMVRVVEEAMAAGARGLSTGLYYPPGFYAHSQELVALARTVARHGGFYSSHIRSESDGLLAAVAEAAEIGAAAELPVEIAHLKVSGCANWEVVDQLIAALQQARSRGIRLGCDQYPYPASSTWLAALLPYWAQAGGGSAIAARLGDPQVRRRLRRDFEEHRGDWDNRSGVRSFQDILIASCPGYPELQGQTVATVAEAEGEEALEMVFDLIIRTECQISCVWFSQSQEVVRRIIQLPFVSVGSDAASLSPNGILGRRQVHPRSYGSFARVLGKYVREEGVLSLAAAVRKMTALPATHLGLDDRGQIRTGAYADLVLFDADQVGDQATFTTPHRFARGIPWVMVNGQVVVDNGVQTEALPGQIL